MIVATAVASIALFGVGFWVFGVAGAAAGALVTSQDAMATMRNKGLDDTEREQSIQQASLRLFGYVASILARTLLTCAAALLPVGLVAVAGFASGGDVLRFLSRGDVILTTTVVMLLGYLARRRLWPSS